jgi:hypothetical protein
MIETSPFDQNRKATKAKVFLFVAFALCALLLQACGAEDVPGFSLELKNNLSMSVKVQPCVQVTCKSFAATVILKPDHVMSTPQTADGIFRPYRVTSLSGATVGCLPFKFKRNPVGKAVVEIGQSVSCGNSGGANAVDGNNWPYS